MTSHKINASGFKFKSSFSLFILLTLSILFLFTGCANKNADEISTDDIYKITITYPEDDGSISTTSVDFQKKMSSYKIAGSGQIESPYEGNKIFLYFIQEKLLTPDVIHNLKIQQKSELEKFVTAIFLGREAGYGDGSAKLDDPNAMWHITIESKPGTFYLCGYNGFPDYWDELVDFMGF